MARTSRLDRSDRTLPPRLSDPLGNVKRYLGRRVGAEDVAQRERRTRQELRQPYLAPPETTSGDGGAVGPAGPAGPAGPQGSPGPAGATGPIGPTGTAGATGATGATGPQGTPGTSGSSDFAFIRSTDFSAVSSVALDGVFTSTYDEYDIMVTVDSGTAVATLYVQLRAAGVTEAGANYDYSGVYNFNTAAAPTGHAGNASNAWYIGSTANGAMDSMSHIIMASPARSRKTRYQTTFVHYSTPSTVTQQVTAVGGHRQATAYDGFLITIAGVSITGNVRVYGRRRV